MFMLIAHGPNNIKMPCRFSEDRDNLVNILTEAFPNSYFNNDVFEISDDDYFIMENENEEKGFNKIFTYYNESCDDIYSFTINEVPVDKKFINWDLD